MSMIELDPQAMCVHGRKEKEKNKICFIGNCLRRPYKNPLNMTV